MKLHLPPRLRARAASAALALLGILGQPAFAATLTFNTSPPTPGANDVYNLTGAATDGANVRDAGTYADGGANDAFTYVAFDRANQGQTFTTGSNSGGYAVASIWLQHAGYNANTNTTYYRQPNGSVLRIRMTRPSLAGTAGFVLDDETYTVSGTEPNKLPADLGATANGTGTWLKFTFATPIVLSPNTIYGFDLTTGSANHFFELAGTSTDSVAGGSAYKGATNGGGGGPDNVLTTLTGDRVFLVELAAVGSAPAFVSQPESYTGFVGANITLAATATGNPAPTYQWQKSTNGGSTWTNVPGATAATLTLNPAAYANNGLYQVLASNGSGTVPSNSATVTLTYPEPTITAGSSSATVLDGTDVVLDVDATGVGTLTYQWSFAGGPLSGQTAATLDLGTVTSADSGTYTVLITDPAGVADGFAATTTTRVIDLAVIPSSVATVAYYRFEDGSDGATISNATDSAGTNTLSSNGAPTYSGNPPLPTVPRTGAANTRAARFPSTASNNGLFAATDGTLATTAFTDFTIEFYMRLDTIGTWQTFVGREDTGSTGEGTGPEALLYIQKAGGVTGNGLLNAFRIELITRDNRNLQLHSQYVPEVATWYHVAVVGSSLDGTLGLYVDGALIQSVPGFNGLFVPSSGAAAPWLIGRGEFNNNPGDYFQGNLDEIRFSQVALPPSRFLRSNSDSNLPPPVITSAPRHVTARAGVATSFTVAATGQGNLSYQWFKDGSPVVSGGASATLNIVNPTAASAGTYSVTISDDAGVSSGFPPTTATASATLQVVDAPLPSRALSLNFVGSSDPTINANYATDLGTLASGESAGFLAVTNWINSAATTFVATSPAALALVENTGAASPAVATWASTNTWGALASGGTAASKTPDRRLFHGYVESRAATGASVTVSNIPYASYDAYVYVAGGANGNVGSLSIDRVGAPTYFYRLISHDTFTGPTTPLPYMLGAATSLSAAQSAPAATFVRFTGVSGPDLTISAIDAVLNANAGGIAAVQIVDTTAPGTPYPPTVTASPVPLLKQGGASATFSVSAVSNNSGGTLSYRWQKDGVDINGQTGASYTRSSLVGSDTGSYSVIVTDTSPLGTVSTTRSTSLVVVDATRSVLINGDFNSGGSSTAVGNGILHADDTQTATDFQQGTATWNGLAGGATTATLALAKESTGLSLPGITVTYSGAAGSEDNNVTDLIAESVSLNLMRDYLYTDSQTTPLTATIGGLQAFAGHRFSLTVYAYGKDTTSQLEGTVEDAATITLTAANNHLGQAPQLTKPYLTGFTSSNAARRVETNNLVSTGGTASAYVSFSGVVSADGTISWNLGPDADAIANRVALNGFQLLVTSENLAPAAPTNLAAVAGDAQVALTWTASSGATSYTIRRGTASGVYTTISQGVETGTSYTDTNVTNGTTYYYVVAAANGILSGTSSSEVSATPAATVTAQQAWRQTHFGTTANIGDAANTADPDNDGQSNLLEYALGTHPKVAGAVPVTVARSGDNLALTFSHTNDATLIYAIQGTNDLGTAWTTIHTYPAFTTSGSTTYTDTAVSLATQPRRFLRLSVTAP